MFHTVPDSPKIILLHSKEGRPDWRRKNHRVCTDPSFPLKYKIKLLDQILFFVISMRKLFFPTDLHKNEHATVNRNRCYITTVTDNEKKMFGQTVAPIVKCCIWRCQTIIFLSPATVVKLHWFAHTSRRDCFKLGLCYCSYLLCDRVATSCHRRLVWQINHRGEVRRRLRRGSN